MGIGTAAADGARSSGAKLWQARTRIKDNSDVFSESAEEQAGCMIITCSDISKGNVCFVVRFGIIFNNNNDKLK